MILSFIKNITIVVFMLSFFVIIYLIFCRSYEHFKGIDKELDKYLVNAFIYRLYFILTTVATIGYGDIVPVSMKARLITIGIILTIFVLILKLFDNIIDSYHNIFTNYLNVYNPATLLKDAIKTTQEAGIKASNNINNFMYPNKEFII